VRRIIALMALVLASVGVAGCFQGGSSGWTVWDSLAQCEAGGNWAANTGNGYYGGLQFSLSTWHAYGGGQFNYWPHLTSREQQIIIGERVQAGQGWGAWPYCSSQLGLR
jgi:Transglycosylase-like domain